MSSDNLIYLVAAEPKERESLTAYLTKHKFNFKVFSDLEETLVGLSAATPTLIVLAGSNIPSPDICKFGATVEQSYGTPIIALLTELQVSIVSEMAESENLWTAEYPISLREIRTSIMEALEEIAGAT